MATTNTLKKRVVQNSARTGNFTHKQARAAAKKAAAKRTEKEQSR
jgi:hypothetical protein